LKRAIYNLGYNYFGIGKGDLTYSIVLGIGINNKVGIYIEPYGEIAGFKELISSADTGITYLIKDNFQLDFSFGTGIKNTMNFKEKLECVFFFSINITRP